MAQFEVYFDTIFLSENSRNLHLLHKNNAIVSKPLLGIMVKNKWCNLEYILLKFALTLSDPGYFRQLTIGGGGFKSPPPYDLENYYVNLHHIIHVNFTRCFWHDPIGIFQNFAILTILQRFQNKK